MLNHDLPKTSTIPLKISDILSFKWQGVPKSSKLLPFSGNVVPKRSVDAPLRWWGVPPRWYVWVTAGNKKTRRLVSGLQAIKPLFLFLPTDGENVYSNHLKQFWLQVHSSLLHLSGMCNKPTQQYRLHFRTVASYRQAYQQ